MIPKTDPGRGRPSEAYQCYGRVRLGVDHSPQRPVPRTLVDTAVWEFFEHVALDVDATRAAITERVDAKLAELDALRAEAEREAAKAQWALAKVKRDYLDGELSASAWQAFHDDLTAERDAAQAHLERLDTQRTQVASEVTALDIEDAVMRELTLIRAAVLGDALDGEQGASTPSVRRWCGCSPASRSAASRGALASAARTAPSLPGRHADGGAGWRDVVPPPPRPGRGDRLAQPRARVPGSAARGRGATRKHAVGLPSTWVIARIATRAT